MSAHSDCLNSVSLGMPCRPRSRLQARALREARARPQGRSHVHAQRPAPSAPSGRHAGRRRCGKPSLDTNSPVDCLCLARGRACGPARPARPRCGLQRPERAGLVRITVVVGHVGRTLLFDQHPPTGEQLHQSGDDFVQHRLQRFVGRRWYFDELRRPVNAAPVHAVQHQAMQVDVEEEPPRLPCR